MCKSTDKSTTTDNTKNDGVGEIDTTTGGFHLFELHAPSVGFSLLYIIGLVLAVMAIYGFYLRFIKTPTQSPGSTPMPSSSLWASLFANAPQQQQHPMLPFPSMPMGLPYASSDFMSMNQQLQQAVSPSPYPYQQPRLPLPLSVPTMTSPLSMDMGRAAVRYHHHQHQRQRQRSIEWRNETPATPPTTRTDFSSPSAIDPGSVNVQPPPPSSPALSVRAGPSTADGTNQTPNFFMP